MNSMKIEKRDYAIFVVNLLQDVNILRPLIFLAAKEQKFKTQILVTASFCRRDTNGEWFEELNEIAANTMSQIIVFESTQEAYSLLQHKGGVIVVGSESNLSAHHETHEIFNVAPNSFIRVTLQHGFECVGFLQSEQHNIAHGTGIMFAADIVCGWFDSEFMRSMPSSEAGKLHVTGPSALLQQPELKTRKKTGLICENLHSVRLNASGDLKNGFIDVFKEFCKFRGNNPVALRPHPGGQFVIKNNVELPKNARIVNKPIYKVNLSEYAYGVTAPSSVVIDMIFAEIPVAIWLDAEGIMDIGNYSGLHVVSSVDDLKEFHHQAMESPDRFLERQQNFITRMGIQADKQKAYLAYKQIFETVKPASQEVVASDKRLLFIANDLVPTLQLSFLKPLKNLVENDEMALDVLTEKDIAENNLSKNRVERIAYIEQRLKNANPSHIVFCRYSGMESVFLLLWAKQRNIPTIYHIDDDLLSIPPNIGRAKYLHHNSKSRLESVRYLLDNVDLIYSSTPALKRRIENLNVSTPVTVGNIYCSSSIIKSAENTPIQKIGYMASADHAHNLDMIIEAIIKILRKYKHVKFELFGSIPKPKSLEEFGDQIEIAPAIQNYEEFLNEFCKRNWDIGLCPLVNIEFNRMKANTKWVEYSACGVAVVASKGTAYDTCIEDNCGVLAESTQDWYDALEQMIESPEVAYAYRCNAQRKLEDEFSIGHLRQQVFDVLEQAEKEQRFEA